MSMIKQDVRFKRASFESIKEISLSEKKSIQDTIRELCDIGIAYKKAKNKEQPNKLTPFENEALKTLNLILSLNNLTVVNTLDFEKTSITSSEELVKVVKENAEIALTSFKKNNNISLDN